MLDTRPRYVLRTFPLFIDPVVLVLEVQLQIVREDASLPTPVWKQLARLQPRPDSFPFTLDSRMVHFFGPEPDVGDCPFLLVYDATGVLRFRFDRGPTGFEQALVPEEVNGRAVTAPSVRVVFRTREAADRYAAVAEGLAAGALTAQEAVDLMAVAALGIKEVRRAPVAAL